MRRVCVFVLTLFALVGCAGGGGSAPVQSNATWTILVYMNAANNLFGESPLNIEEMQQAAYNSNVKIIVQWKQSQSNYPQSTFNGTRRYIIKPSSSATVSSGLIQDLGTGVDMGNPQTLNDFITWAKATYPADRYCLVLWDHGNGWRPKARPGIPPQTHKQPAFSYDDQTGHAIQIWNLPTALGNQQFDMIVWDCSLMQMAENAYELRNNTRYIVGSEESPPAQGFPYNTVLANFQNNPGADTLTLAKTWVDGINSVGAYASDPIEESVIDTRPFSTLCGNGGPIDNLAAALSTNLAAVNTTTANVRTQGKSYDPTSNPPRYYYDLYSIANIYKTQSSVSQVQKAATAVLNGLSSAVVYEKHNTNSSGSHGLSIDFSPSSAFTPYTGEYDQMAFGAANRWSQWLTVAP